MPISNGYDTDKVLAALRPRIGWNEPLGVPVEGSLPVLSAANLESISGKRYDSYHALVSVLNLRDTQEYTGLDDTELNTVLGQKKDSSILAVISAIFSLPQIVDSRKMLYTRRIQDSGSTVVNTGHFVGYRLKVSEGKYLAQVLKATFLFDGPATFTLKVFREFKKTPVYSQEVTVAAAYEEQEVTLPAWVLDNGKSYFLGYDQRELGAVRAINDPACISRYTLIGVSGVASPLLEDGSPNTIKYQCTGENYGINLQLESYRDYTEDIVQNASLFDDAQGLQMAIDCVQEIKYSTRSNNVETITREMAGANSGDLNGDLNADSSYYAPVAPGLRAMYRKEISKLTKTFFPKKGIEVVSPR